MSALTETFSSLWISMCLSCSSVQIASPLVKRGLHPFNLPHDWHESPLLNEILGNS